MNLKQQVNGSNHSRTEWAAPRFAWTPFIIFWNEIQQIAIAGVWTKSADIFQIVWESFLFPSSFSLIWNSSEHQGSCAMMTGLHVLWLWTGVYWGLFLETCSSKPADFKARIITLCHDHYRLNHQQKVETIYLQSAPSPVCSSDDRRILDCFEKAVEQEYYAVPPLSICASCFRNQLHPWLQIFIGTNVQYYDVEQEVRRRSNKTKRLTAYQSRLYNCLELYLRDSFFKGINSTCVTVFSKKAFRSSFISAHTGLI